MADAREARPARERRWFGPGRSAGSTPWRAGVERALRRVRDLGVVGWLRLERDTVVQLARTSLAAGAAWEAAARLAGSRLPALASLAAIVVSQVTLSKTLAQGAQYVVAVVVGVALALLAVEVAGANALVVTGAIFAALLVGRALRLGAQATQVAFSALLVLALGTAYGVERTIDAAIGAVVGIAVNVVLPPPTFVAAAGRSLRGVGEDLAGLCTDVATGLEADWGEDTARGWLRRARGIDEDLDAAAEAVERGGEGLRYNPRGRLPSSGDAEALGRHEEALHALEHAVTQVRGVARTLLDLHQARGGVPAPAGPVLAAVADLLVAAGAAARSFGVLQDTEPAAWADEREVLRDAVRTGEEARDASARALRALPVPGDPLARALASVLVDAERLLRELDPDRGEHTGAVPDPRPASPPTRDR